MRIVRWRALGPLGVFGGLFLLVWILFADRMLHDAVEDVGADFVGARVDLEFADIRLGDGQIVLRGLQVANPQSPMQNLVQADEIVAIIDPVALLEKKVVIDTLAFRGMRFGTARSESGALDGAGGAGQANRTVAAWMEALDMPPLTLEGFGQMAGLDGLDASRLRSIDAARSLQTAADSTRRDWERELEALNPEPLLDSARALISQLEGLRPNPLTIVRARQRVESARSIVGRLDESRDRLATLEQAVRTTRPSLEQRLAAVEALRQQDYAYARQLLRLPSLDQPDLSGPLLGDYASEKAAPLIYWGNLLAENVPPGLDPRNRPGPKRARRAGTSVVFPRQASYPALLIAFAEATMSLGGQGAAAGEYALRIEGLTTEPAVYGRPLIVSVSRLTETLGPRSVQAHAVIDHRRDPVRDSVRVSLGGVALADIPIPPLGAMLQPGQGSMEIDFRRFGDSVSATWTIRSAQATWRRIAAPGPDSSQVGSGPWIEGLLWRSVENLREVEIEIGLRGTLTQPSLVIRSNIGRVVARRIREALGEEVRRLEGQARQEVDRRIGGFVSGAQSQVRMLSGPLSESILGQAAQMETVKAELERQIQEASRRVLGGIRIP